MERILFLSKDFNSILIKVLSLNKKRFGWGKKHSLNGEIPGNPRIFCLFLASMPVSFLAKGQFFFDEGKWNTNWAHNLLIDLFYKVMFSFIFNMSLI